MTSPVNSVTTDEGRWYEWPKLPGQRFPSITTIIKQGVPKPFLQNWASRRVAETAFEELDLLNKLKERANAN